jgi:anti-anti-sigma regulatory factor
VGDSTKFTAFASVMPGAEHSAEANIPLKISGDHTIQTSEALRKSLADYLDRGLPIELDLSQVHACDVVFLQLIYAMRRSAIQRERSFRIAAVSPVVTETAAALGLSTDHAMPEWKPAHPESACENADIEDGI